MRRLDPYVVFLSVVATVLVWSAIRPRDYGVWIFELSLGLVGVALLIATRRRFALSGLVYALAALHFTILACGAKYTYAEMPLFNWLRDTLHLSRNHFDRVGHLAQGFIPAMFVREFLRRAGGLRPGALLGFLCVSVCLAFSAFYEILEWRVVLTFYAQEDMLMALIGSSTSILALSSLHERSMAALPDSPARATPRARV